MDNPPGNTGLEGDMVQGHSALFSYAKNQQGQGKETEIDTTDHKLTREHKC
jgi:hypothetical protein